MEEHLDELAHVAVLELLHDADLARKRRVPRRAVLPHRLRRPDHLHRVPLARALMDRPTHRRERALAELDSDVVRRVQSDRWRPCRSVPVHEACATD